MQELERVTNLAALEAAAREKLSPAARDYYAGGAEDGWTLAANRAAFGRWALRPRVLVDVQRIDAAVELPGGRAAFPALVAPMGFQRLAHSDGELAMARAAARAGTI
ncbi:MAG: alpha-hydroxy-acid oxidizing protein, partial [Longimicrobiales bacterium]